MNGYLLDTSTVSHSVRRNQQVNSQIEARSLTVIHISVITEAELLFGLARRPESRQLNRAVHEFLRRAVSMPWTSEAARLYGDLRASLERTGKVFSPLDTLIAAHAISLQAVLVTSGKAFARIPGLQTEDWTIHHPPG